MSHCFRSENRINYSVFYDFPPKMIFENMGGKLNFFKLIVLKNR